MNRRSFLGALAGGAAARPAGAAARRPNILLIMVDDMGFSDLGCYGSEIATPNVNQLAAQGIRFTQFYNNARCCPTRASLMTGLYPHQAGIGHMVTADCKRPGYRGDLNRHCVTIAEALRPAGYRTLMAGKWHLTPPGPDHQYNWPLQRGFEKFFGTIPTGWNYYNPEWLLRDNTRYQPGKGFYYTDAIADTSTAYIQEYAGKPEPFFLYTAFTAPHWPLHAFPEDIAKYRDRYREGWDVLRAERHRRMLELGIVESRWPITPRDSRIPAWKEAPDKEWHMRRMAVYAAQIERMDRGVGRILAALRNAGIEDNTLVLFLADNGGCAEELKGNNPAVMPGPEETFQSYGMGWANASNTPFRLYKHWVHEGGISAPLIARWPARIRARGGLTQQYGQVMDIMATCLDVAGAEYPKTHQGTPITPLEGKSLLPVLDGGKRPAPDVYWEHEGNRALRRGRWKLVSRYPDGWELFDMESDRTEMRDLASANAARVSEMAALWDRWAARANVAPWDAIRPCVTKR